LHRHQLGMHCATLLPSHVGISVPEC
jgi:hypothetical protein